MATSGSSRSSECGRCRSGACPLPGSRPVPPSMTAYRWPEPRLRWPTRDAPGAGGESPARLPGGQPRRARSAARPGRSTRPRAHPGADPEDERHLHARRQRIHCEEPGNAHLGSAAGQVDGAPHERREAGREDEPAPVPANRGESFLHRRGLEGPPEGSKARHPAREAAPDEDGRGVRWQQAEEHREERSREPDAALAPEHSERGRDNLLRHGRQDARLEQEPGGGKPDLPSRKARELEEQVLHRASLYRNSPAEPMPGRKGADPGALPPDPAEIGTRPTRDGQRPGAGWPRAAGGCMGRGWRGRVAQDGGLA